MADVFSLIGALVIGVVAGLMTGFYFERRAKRNSRRENDELRRQISVLGTRVRSLGARPDREPAVAGARDLAGSVTARALATQDPGGRVNRRELVAHFLERGDDARDVDAVISSMCRAGTAKEDGPWLQLT